MLELRGLAQRADQPTHQDDNILDLLVEVDGSNITTNVRVVDPGQSDHFLLLLSVNVWRPMPTLVRYSFRDFRAMGPDDFAAMPLEITDVYRSRRMTLTDSVIRSSPQ